MAFREYLSFRHYLWYGILMPILTTIWYNVLLVVLGLSFLAFLMFWGYGWGYTRWYLWDSWFSR